MSKQRHADQGETRGTSGAPDDGAREARPVEPTGQEEAAAEEGHETPEETADRSAELEEKWLRAQAEIENTRRRARMDVEEARRYGAMPLLQSLLGVLDTLQRALEMPLDGPQASQALLEGLRLTEQQFQQCLAAHGVVPVDSEPGAPFDPTVHRALLEQPTAEWPEGTIVNELARGYRLHERLLREAQVVVARAPDAAPDGGDEAPPRTPEDGDHADV